MALPRLGAGGQDGLDYFSKVSELIHNDEHRRNRRKQRGDSDTDSKDQQMTGSQSAAMLPTISGSQQMSESSAPMDPMRSTKRGFANRFAGSDQPGLLHSRSCNQFDRSDFAPGGRYNSAELPSLPGGHHAAVSSGLTTPQARQAGMDQFAAGPTPSNRCGRGMPMHSMDNSDVLMQMHRTGTRMTGFADGSAMQRSESYDSLPNRQGQIPSHMLGVHNSIDCSGKSVTTFHRTGGIPSLGKVSSLPSLQGTASCLCDTQRQTWHRGGANTDSTASTPDIPQQPQHAATASASACPWAAPWQPTVSPDLEPVVNRVPTFPVPPVPPVPIRGVPCDQSQAAANPWEAPWQPRAAADAVLGPLGELPSVAELSERSSMAYPNSLSGRPALGGNMSTDTSPFRTPVSGIGPPSRETYPPVGTVNSFLDNAMHSQDSQPHHAPQEQAYCQSPMHHDRQQHLPTSPLHHAAEASSRPAPIETSCRSPMHQQQVNQTLPASPLHQPAQPTHSASPLHQQHSQLSMPSQGGMSVTQAPPCALLSAPHVSSPLARPTANCSPEFFPDTRAALHSCIENSKPPPPLCEPASAQYLAQESTNSSSEVHRPPALDSPTKGTALCPAPGNYPPSPTCPAASQQPIARGNDHMPRSPLTRKDCMQKSRSMGAVPVLGPLPSLSLRTGPR